MISGNEKYQAAGATRILNFHSPSFRNCFTNFRRQHGLYSCTSLSTMSVNFETLPVRG